MMGVILLDVRLPDKTFGKQIVSPSFKGRINPDFDLPEFIEKIGKFELLLGGNAGHIILNGRNRISVVPIPLADGKIIKIVIKEFFPRGLKRIKTIVLPSRAQKAWRGGVALMRLGIPTPVPVGYLESRRSPHIRENCYLSLLVEGVEEIRHLFRRLLPDELYLLIMDLARHLRLCHHKGILHRDLSDGNILVKDSREDGFTFFLIDTNRIRLKKRLGRLQRIKNLTRLGVPVEHQRRFLDSYAGSEGLKKKDWLWYKFSKKAYTWHINLKKRLLFRREAKTENST